MTENNAILISILNLSHSILRDVSDAINMLGRDGEHFQINNNFTKSHLVVIDVDDETGKEKFQQTLSGQVKLLISTNLISGRNIVSIKKPVDSEVLKSILSKLYGMMSNHLNKQATASNPDKTECSLITDTLFYSLFEAKKNKCYLHVYNKNIELFVDGNNQSVKYKGSIDNVRKIVQLPFNELAVNKIDNSTFQKLSNDLNVVTLHNILWSSAIYNSNGRLLPAHDEHKAVKLRAWPSFTRNDFKPEHLKIAAILAQKTISLTELAKQSDISYFDIVNFYNAAFAVDLFDQNVTNPEYEKNVSQPKINSVKSSLLNKIATRLGFNYRISGSCNG